jgi:hypothetical protein
MRMRAVGLTQDYTCDLPIRQTDLADATGLSAVHLNRSLQSLRKEGLIALSQSKLSVLDWEGLKLAGDFDPRYLHLRERPTRSMPLPIRLDRVGT